MAIDLADPTSAALLNVITMLDIVVIEPAGNGDRDLDLLLRSDGTSLDRTMFNCQIRHSTRVQRLVSE
jgi:hypothetical protein